MKYLAVFTILCLQGNDNPTVEDVRRVLKENNIATSADSDEVVADAVRTYIEGNVPFLVHNSKCLIKTDSLGVRKLTIVRKLEEPEYGEWEYVADREYQQAKEEEEPPAPLDFLGVADGFY